jgi:GT2 family glycosyltransferase
VATGHLQELVSTRSQETDLSVRPARKKCRCPKVMVSVIVPLYNKAPYIGRAIDSILRQSRGDFEIIVVDDGSTDGSREIAESLREPTVRVIAQANAGPGAARNAGIAQARGSLLAFLDADDEWFPTFLERSVALLDREPAAASVTSAWVREPPGVSTVPIWRGRGLESQTYRLDASSAPGFVVELLAFTSWTCSTVMRAEIVRKYGGFYERGSTYGEDAFLMLKVLLAEPVIVNLEALATYHVDASALNRAAVAVRAVEAFLQDPSDLYARCPPGLQGLLNDVLAARALKTACVLTYWGRWREGRDLMRRFKSRSAWKLPFFAHAHVGVNPLGAAAATAWRSCRRLAS